MSRCLSRWLALVLALTGLAAMPARAARVLDVRVTRDQSSFRIGMRIVIRADAAAVFRALQDYAAMPRYNPDLRAVSIQPTPQPNRVRLLTTLHTCVLFFCRMTQQQEFITAVATARGGVLQAELISQQSAFAGHGLWTVQPCQGDRSPPTCLTVQILLMPRFWVPAVIGPWVMRRKMTEEAQRSGQGLEQVALAGAAGMSSGPSSGPSPGIKPP